MKLIRTVSYLRGASVSKGIRCCISTEKCKHDNQVAPSERGPLNGIRVCDMSRVLVGPYCTMILGDMGAEVIKIERPGMGDETRGWGPPFVEDQSCYFLSINRNKKGIAVDVKSAKGKEIIYKLVSMSDVFVENFVPGKMSELGFGYDDLVKVNPKIIYSSMSGFGDKGPSHKKPGYDLIASACGGLLSITGEKDEICKPGIAITDLMTGMFSLNAIIQALNERRHTGVGKYIRASLFQSQLAMLSSVGVAVLNTGENIERSGTAHHAISPCEVFETSDGRLAVVASSDADFQSLCKAMLQEHLIKDSRFSSNSVRVRNRNALSSLLRNWFKEKSTDECVSILTKHNVPHSVVNNIRESYESEQAHALNMIQQLEHSSAGKIRVSGSAVEFRNSTKYELPPPLLGEHTSDILMNLLRYSQDEIQQLQDEKVIHIH